MTTEKESTCAKKEGTSRRKPMDFIVERLRVCADYARPSA